MPLGQPMNQRVSHVPYNAMPLPPLSIIRKPFRSDLRVGFCGQVTSSFCSNQLTCKPWGHMWLKPNVPFNRIANFKVTHSQFETAYRILNESEGKIKSIKNHQQRTRNQIVYVFLNFYFSGNVNHPKVHEGTFFVHIMNQLNFCTKL